MDKKKIIELFVEGTTIVIATTTNLTIRKEEKYEKLDMPISHYEFCEYGKPCQEEFLSGIEIAKDMPELISGITFTNDIDGDNEKW